MKKLVAMLLTMLPLAVLADVAPMSRDEWERHRQFMRSFTTPSFDTPSFAGYALALGAFALLLPAGLKCIIWVCAGGVLISRAVFGIFRTMTKSLHIL